MVTAADSHSADSRSFQYDYGQVVHTHVHLSKCIVNQKMTSFYFPNNSIKNRQIFIIIFIRIFKDICHHTFVLDVEFIVR